MHTIKQKLHSKLGASMLITLVFLLVCLMIGGSVLAAATANGSRVKNMQHNEQTYLSQRSAMFLLSDMLKNDQLSDLQLIIKDVTVETSSNASHTITFILPEGEKTELQRILYENTIDIFIDAYRDKFSPLPQLIFENFCFTGVPEDMYIFLDVTSQNGEIPITADLSEEQSESLVAHYSSSNNFDFLIDFDTESQVVLSVEAITNIDFNKYFSSEYDHVVVESNGIKTTTKTSIIQWDDPQIKKRGS